MENYLRRVLDKKYYEKFNAPDRHPGRYQFHFNMDFFAK